MLLKRSPPCLLFLVCTVALGLSGCAAAPVTQRIVSQIAPATPPCTSGPGCQTDVASNSFGDISKGVTNSFHRLIGSTLEPSTVGAGGPAR
jgi:hypothetical protein